MLTIEPNISCFIQLYSAIVTLHRCITSDMWPQRRSLVSCSLRINSRKNNACYQSTGTVNFTVENSGLKTTGKHYFFIY